MRSAASSTAIIRIGMAVAARGHPIFTGWLSVAEVLAVVQLLLVFVVAELWHRSFVRSAKQPRPSARPPYVRQTAVPSPPISLQPPTAPPFRE